ncbi:MAG: acyl-CoA thioesterase [Candidatus Gastranaerophilales bacterium]|nr:acyl-CoA thioesterase [Candidatus Gastranaerophilales bacterium]
MEYIQEIRVLYSDTDSYGVVWHGAYTKWFEQARVELVEKLGLDLDTLEKNKILFPVVQMDIRYKSSAKMNERILIKTVITEIKPVSVTFEHIVSEKATGKIRVIAHTTIVVIDSETGKMFRKMPDELYNKFISGSSQEKI